MNSKCDYTNIILKTLFDTSKCFWVSEFLTALTVVIVFSATMGITKGFESENSELYEMFFIEDDLNQTIFADLDYWMPDPPEKVPSWTLIDTFNRQKWSGSVSYGPVIAMAGYMDTDVSWLYGGYFRMLAWVYSPDDAVESVEIYFEGRPTGVFLKDDGMSSDYGAGNSLYGLTFYIAPHQMIPGDYTLELRARDTRGFESDLWPYLMVHD